MDAGTGDILATESINLDDDNFKAELLRTNRQITTRMKTSTDLDCRKVSHADLAICQSLSVINLQPGFNLAIDGCSEPGNRSLDICAQPSNNYYHYFNSAAQARIPTIIAQAKIPQPLPLATYQCGGPDSMAIDGFVNNQQGACMYAWSKKVSVFGQCQIPNGKGVITAGKGCMVQSCFPGFAPNPSNRACLKLDAPCYRPDLVANTYDAYLAEVNLDGNYENKNVSKNFNNAGGIGRFNRCMIKSCRGGYGFVDMVRPVNSGFTGNGVILNPTGYGTLGKGSPTYGAYTRLDSGRKPLTPQYVDMCLSAKNNEAYQAHLNANFNKGVMPGQWCAIGSAAEGVYSYANGTLACHLSSCVNEDSYNSGTATSPHCVPQAIGGLKDSCSNQKCLSAFTGKYDGRCLNTSTNFLEIARKECHLAPANMLFGFDESHKSLSIGPDKYVPSAFKGDYMYLRSTDPWLNSITQRAPQPFARYLPRWSSGRTSPGTSIDHRYEYIDIFTQKVVAPSQLVDNLNY